MNLHWLPIAPRMTCAEGARMMKVTQALAPGWMPGASICCTT